MFLNPWPPCCFLLGKLRTLFSNSDNQHALFSRHDQDVQDFKKETRRVIDKYLGQWNGVLDIYPRRNFLISFPTETLEDHLMLLMELITFEGDWDFFTGHSYFLFFDRLQLVEHFYNSLHKTPTAQFIHPWFLVLISSPRFLVTPTWAVRRCEERGVKATDI